MAAGPVSPAVCRGFAPSLLRDSKGLPDGTRIDCHLLSLPLYMVDQARRLVVEFESKRGGNNPGYGS